MDTPDPEAATPTSARPRRPLYLDDQNVREAFDLALGWIQSVTREEPTATQAWIALDEALARMRASKGRRA